MALSLRGTAASGGNQGATTATSQAITLPTGTTTNDLVYFVISIGATGVTGAAAAGWTLVTTDLGATPAATAIVGYRTIQAGDLAPTVTWTGAGKVAWSAIALAPASGKQAVHSGFATVLSGTTTATSRTPNSYAAGAASGASVILNAHRASATATTAIATTPPTNWTEPTTGDQSTSVGNTSTTRQVSTEVSYRLAQTGTIAPGSEAVSPTSFSVVSHAFAVEQDPPTGAVAFDANADAYSSTVGLPSGTTWSATCWAYIDVDRNTYSGVLTLRGSPTGTIYVLTLPDGVTLGVWDDATYGSSPFAQNVLSVGAWHRIGIVVSGANITFYFGAATGSLTSSSVTDASPPAVPSILYLGRTQDSVSWWHGRLAAFKMWSAALTGTEIADELAQYDAVRTSNLLRAHRFINVETTDYSGNGNSLTNGGGSPSAASGPSIPLDVGTSYTETVTDTAAAADVIYPAFGPTASLTSEFAAMPAFFDANFGSPSIVAGQLSVPTVATYAGAATSRGYSLTDSSVYVQVVTASGTSGTRQNALKCKVNNSNLNSVEMLLDGGVFKGRVTKAGVDTDVTLNGGTYNATTHAWWRVRESGGTVYWDTAPDGTTWTNLGSAAHGLTLTAVNVFLQSGYYGTETTPPAAVYDNLNTPLTVAHSETITDSAAAADTATSALTAAQTITDTAADTDTVSPVATHAQTITDTAADTDTVSPVQASATTITDTAPTADTASPAQTWAVAVTDTAAAIDTAAGAATAARTITDTTTTADSTSTTATTLVEVVDAAPSADTAAAATTYTRTTTDSVAAADTPTAAQTAARPVTDTAAAADTAATAQGWAATFTDTASAADTASGAQSWAAAVADTAAAVDSVSVEGSGGIQVGDTAAATDHVVAAVTYAQTITDTAAAADATSLASARTVTVADTAGTTDTTSLTAGYTRPVTDTTGIADTTTRASVYVREVADSAATTDDVAAETTSGIPSEFTELTVVDVIAASDTADWASTYAATFTDTASVADSAYRGSALDLFVADTVAVADRVLSGTAGALTWLYATPAVGNPGLTATRAVAAGWRATRTTPDLSEET